MGKPTARIDNWIFYCGFLAGHVHGHQRQSGFMKEFQLTSAVVRFDPENGIAETRNTVYNLGIPAISML